jgi:hypothetical protein
MKTLHHEWTSKGGITLDIASLSMSMNQSKVLQQVGIAMLDKQLSNTEDVGDLLASSLTTMPSPSLESMVNPAVGGNIDMLV